MITTINNLFIFRKSLFDYYVNEVNQILNTNYRKYSFIQIIQIVCYLINVIKFIICLFVTNYDIRLYLYDMTLFWKGISVYNNLVLMIGNLSGLVLFIICRSHINKTTIKWIELIEVVRGKINPGTNNMYNLIKSSLNKPRMLLTVLSNICWFNFISMGK